MKAPIRISKRGTVTLDVLALQAAMEAGTLSDGDRATAERLLPGITADLAKRILEHGKNPKPGNVLRALAQIAASRDEALGGGK